MRSFLEAESGMIWLRSVMLHRGFSISRLVCAEIGVYLSSFIPFSMLYYLSMSLFLPLLGIEGYSQQELGINSG